MGTNNTMLAPEKAQANDASGSAFENASSCRGMSPPVLSLTADGDQGTAPGTQDSPLLEPEFIAELTAAIQEELMSEQDQESTDDKAPSQDVGSQGDEDLQSQLAQMDDETVLGFLNDPEFTSLMKEVPGAFEEIFLSPDPTEEIEKSQEEGLDEEGIQENDPGISSDSQLQEQGEDGKESGEQPTIQAKAGPVVQRTKTIKKKKKLFNPYKVQPISLKPQYFSYSYAKHLKIRKRMQHYRLGKIHPKYGGATYMNAVIGPKAPMIGTGCSPKVRPNWYKTIKRKKIKDFFSRKIVQAHLMNDNLGGTGRSMKNLATFTKSANSYHEKLVEKHMKTAIKNGNYIEYEVNIDYSTHPSAKSIGGKKFYNSLSSKDKKELKRICLLMPGKMVCNSTVFDKNGNIVKGLDMSTTIYNEDSSIK